MKRSVWIITTSRADYGLLINLMKELKEDERCSLKIIATGMHASKMHGETYKMIIEDGFEIYKLVDIELNDDSAASIVRSIGIGCIKFADIFNDERPDIAVVLGDRFDLLPVLISCLVNNIIVAHIHGGEISEGAIDESIRHSISKMSQYHFPAAEEYKDRLIQMGEDPEKIFNFGAPGLDSLYKISFMSRKEFVKKIGLKEDEKIALVTFHPATTEDISPDKEASNVTQAILETGIQAIFTSSNADKYGSIINKKFREFCESYPAKFKFFENLGNEMYYNALKYCDVMIGNSSSGLTEAPSFKLPVINIGSRQKGRIKAKNIIDADTDKESIKKSLYYSISNQFKNLIADVENPYDKLKNGMTSISIKEKLLELSISGSVLKKKFYKLNSIA
ncbi:UDP-N-acetylglucosamine 2-epimerase [soil metagenome]